MKAKRKTSEIVERLTGEEAKALVCCLLKGRPDLRGDVEQAAHAVLNEVSFRVIADRVQASLRCLTLDNLDDRAGRHGDGHYTSPTEAAGMLLEEAVEPFVQDMKRRMELGHEAEALEVCKGILLGLYRMRRQMRGDDFRGWAEDFPGEHASWVFDIWSGRADQPRGRRRLAEPKRWLPRAFLERYIPDWDGMAEPQDRTR